MTNILPFVIYSAIPIAAVVIWLVARNVMRSEIQASNQLVERRRKEWRAGGCVGPGPGGCSGAATAEAEAAAAAAAQAATAAEAEAAEAVEAAAAEAATERVGAARGEVPALRHLTHRAVTRLSTVAARLLSGEGNPA